MAGIREGSDIDLEDGTVIISVLGQRLSRPSVSDEDDIANDIQNETFGYNHMDFILVPTGQTLTSKNGEILQPNAQFASAAALEFRATAFSAFVVNGTQDHRKITAGEFRLTALEGTGPLLMADATTFVNSTTFIANESAFENSTDGTLLSGFEEETDGGISRLSAFIEETFGATQEFDAYIVRIILDTGSASPQDAGFYGFGDPR